MASSRFLAETHQVPTAPVQLAALLQFREGEPCHRASFAIPVGNFEPSPAPGTHHIADPT